MNTSSDNEQESQEVLLTSNSNHKVTIGFAHSGVSETEIVTSTIT